MVSKLYCAEMSSGELVKEANSQLAPILCNFHLLGLYWCLGIYTFNKVPRKWCGCFKNRHLKNTVIELLALVWNTLGPLSESSEFRTNFWCLHQDLGGTLIDFYIKNSESQNKMNLLYLMSKEIL